MRRSKNLLMELGGGYPTAGQVEMAVRELGAERVIYGSDITGRGFASQLGKVQSAAVPPQAKALIFSENLLRLMTPILQAKGIQTT